MERATYPRWSPGGKTIAFVGVQEGNYDIYVVDVEGGFKRRLTQGDYRELHPAWSHDGQWIYFGSNRSGDRQLWKIPAEGGQPIQITKKGGSHPRESEDRKFLYYVGPPSRPGCDIWRVPVDGGEESPVFKDPQMECGIWTLWGQNIVYSPFSEGSVRPIVLFDLESRRMTEIASFESQSNFWNGMSVSPDGRWILLSKEEPSLSDIMLVENFR